MHRLLSLFVYLVFVGCAHAPVGRTALAQACVTVNPVPNGTIKNDYRNVFDGDHPFTVIDAPIGSPLYALRDGIVEKLEVHDRASSSWIIVSGSDPKGRKQYDKYYFGPVRPLVDSGDRITAGQLLAHVGPGTLLHDPGVRIQIYRECGIGQDCYTDPSTLIQAAVACANPPPPAPMMVFTPADTRRAVALKSRRVPTRR